MLLIFWIFDSILHELKQASISILEFFNDSDLFFKTGFIFKRISSDVVKISGFISTVIFRFSVLDSKVLEASAIKNDVFGKKTIKVTNIGGPLNHLKNTWHFKDQENGTEISFDIDFEIENKFLNIVMTKSFQFGLDKIADAFQKRAEELFSKS